MMSRTLLVLTLAISIAPHAAAQGTAGQLSAARELYAAARYEEALALLDGVRASEAALPANRRTIEQYRSLCLLALGRATEAEAAIASLVTADPMYQPSQTDASPRVRAAFTEVRQRVLPSIAATQYAAAKRLYDAKSYAAAIAEFRALMQLLDDPDMKGQQADLRVLASGFLELSVAASSSATPPKADVAQSPAEPVAQAPVTERIYTQQDPGVIAPVAIKQELPRVPSSISRQVRDGGLVEVVVDELGRVTWVSIRTSLHPVYDNLLLSSAREWRYRPAIVGGAAVKFRKAIQISLAKR
jgi:hypothetical protein